MSEHERFQCDPALEIDEVLGDFPPGEALLVLALEHDRTPQISAIEPVLMLEDLDRLQPTRDRELILALA
jgi:hypothetical protein